MTHAYPTSSSAVRKAAEGGRIWKAVEDDALDAEVDALATRFASAPTQGLAAIKTMIRESWGHTLDEELDLQRDRLRELGMSHDYREGGAASMEERMPKFTGRQTDERRAGKDWLRLCKSRLPACKSKKNTHINML